MTSPCCSSKPRVAWASGAHHLGLSPQSRPRLSGRARQIGSTHAWAEIFLPGAGWIINVTTNAREQTLRTMGRVVDPKSFGDLVIATRNGAPIRIRDIGHAEDGTKEQRSLSRLNGVPTVMLRSAVSPARTPSR